MVSPKGNPNTDNLAAIFGAVRQRLGVGLEVRTVEAHAQFAAATASRVEAASTKSMPHGGVAAQHPPRPMSLDQT
jgi:hypothetical protein